MFNTEQSETSNQRQQPKVTKPRSRAIKIVDPETQTEVKVGGDTPTPAPSAKVAADVAEFKSKVQSTIDVRPNAIITNPDKGEGSVGVGMTEPQDGVGVATDEDRVGVVSETEKVESQQHVTIGTEGVRELTTPTVTDMGGGCEDVVRPSEETGQHEKDEVVKPHPPQDGSQVHVEMTDEKESMETPPIEGVAGEEQPPVSRDNSNKSADSGVSTLGSNSIPERVEEVVNTVELEPENPEMELVNAEKASVIESEQVSTEPENAVEVESRPAVVEPVSASLSNSVTQVTESEAPAEILTGGPAGAVSECPPTETVSECPPTETVSKRPPTETETKGPIETPAEVVSGGPTETVVSGAPTKPVSEVVSGGPTEEVTEQPAPPPTDKVKREQGKSKPVKVVPVFQKGRCVSCGSVQVFDNMLITCSRP